MKRSYELEDDGVEKSFLRRSKRIASASISSELPKKIHTPNPKPVSVKNVPVNLVKHIDNWDNWVSPTKLKNYFLKDGFLDWVCHNESQIPKITTHDHKVSTPQRDSADNINYLFQKGIEFEDHVVNLLKIKLGMSNIVDIGCKHGSREDEKYKQTIDAIRNRVPIIYSGVLRNYDNESWGIPDLIVRTDFLNRIVKTSPNDVNHDNSYRIIDIKFQTMYLRADSTHLLNRALVTAYKAQVYVYTSALNKVLENYGMEPSTAGYLLGRKWTCKSMGDTYNGRSCFDKLGKIDYAGIDSDITEQVPKALEWLRTCKADGNKWDMTKYPLERKELYPNMCNSYDYPYHKIKENYATKMSDITLMWMCGTKQRDIAISKGKYTLDQLTCCEDLGFKPSSKCGPIIDVMIKVHKMPDATVYISNNNITTDVDIWNNAENINNQNYVEFYVDFETMNDAFFPFKGAKVDATPKIFMIGVGVYRPATKEWQYINFTVDRVTFDDEKKICDQFIKFVHEVKNSVGMTSKAIMYHWSPAEPSSFDDYADRSDDDSGKSLLLKLIDSESDDIVWYDVCKLFKTEPIIVKDVYGFGLKPIAKQMKKFGYIDSVWCEDSACQSGLQAMIVAAKSAEKSYRDNVNFSTLPEIKDVIRYNEIDCKVVQEILIYLRTKSKCYTHNDIDTDDTDDTDDYIIL
jgi:hypothetical protein